MRHIPTNDLFLDAVAAQMEADGHRREHMALLTEHKNLTDAMVVVALQNLMAGIPVTDVPRMWARWDDCSYRAVLDFILAFSAACDVGWWRPNV